MGRVRTAKVRQVLLFRGIADDNSDVSIRGQSAALSANRTTKVGIPPMTTMAGAVRQFVGSSPNGVTSREIRDHINAHYPDKWLSS